MKYASIFLAVCLGLGAFPLAAEETEVEGVGIPESLEVDDQTLVLNGAGERSKYFMQIYVGALYLPSESEDASAVIEDDEAKAISMHITSGLISRDRMVETIEEGFQAAMDGDPSPIQDDIDRLIESFDDEIEDGDLVELIYVPDDGLTVRHNGDRVGKVEGDNTFTEALFTIWLGDEPAQDSLKQDMLGRES